MPLIIYVCTVFFYGLFLVWYGLVVFSFTCLLLGKIKVFCCCFCQYCQSKRNKIIPFSLTFFSYKYKIFLKLLFLSGRLYVFLVGNSNITAVYSCCVQFEKHSNNKIMKKHLIQRIIAFYIDCFICIIIALPFYYFFFNPENSNPAIPELNYLGYYQVYVMLCYFPIVEGIFKTTIGKHIFRLHIEFKNMKYHPIFYATIRTITRMIPFESISFLFNKNQYMWHEILSKTKTVKKSR